MTEAPQVQPATEHAVNPLIGELNADLLAATVFLTNSGLTTSELSRILITDAIHEGRTEVAPENRAIDTSDSKERSFFRLGATDFVIIEQSAKDQEIKTPTLLVAVMRQELFGIAKQEPRILRAAALRAAVRQTKKLHRFDPPKTDPDL